MHATGYAALDELLPDGGWPQTGLVDMSAATPGCGEYSLWLPLMARLSAHQGIVLINPPFNVHTPALSQAGVALTLLTGIRSPTPQDAWWCAESALRTRDCGLAMLWVRDVPAKVARRLQVAAQEGQALGVLFRDGQAPVPHVDLRLSTRRRGPDIEVHRLKARGASVAASCVITP